MDKDKYEEIVNGENTYKKIAEKLRKGESVIIGWTDGECAHLDLLFNYNAYKEGILQGGLREYDLFVSIMRCGAFGFDVKKADKSEGYIAEKLNIHGEPTITKLTELINNIIKRL